MPGADPNYDRAAGIYDALSQAYSLGRIRRVKRAALKHLKPGERVMFLGVGTGDEAARAAAQGVDVTCIDLSGAMLKRLEERLRGQRLAAELIEGDAMAHERFGHYDAVVGNFFFNVFDEPRMELFLAHAAKLAKPDGGILIADLAPPQGSPPARLFNRFYARAGMAPFWLAGLVAWHPTYDYRPRLARLGFGRQTVEDFALFPGGPTMFRLIAARRGEG
jgi:demethylphylloquinol methyltransferase